jgi:carbonic anhydrase
MDRCRALLGALVVGMLCGACAHATPPVHWTYAGPTGPQHWGELSPEFALCSTGRLQSPIDLGGASTGDDFPIAFDYVETSLRIAHNQHTVGVLNNGHTIQVTYDAGSEITLGGVAYGLEQYHFHAPSEHAADGRQFSMEIHLVHQSADRALLVVGVLVEEGAHNPAFEPVWANLPGAPGDAKHLAGVMVDVDDLVPDDRRAYRYLGSLTTPPCSEGVRWVVLATPVELSPEQVAEFTAIVPPNNRPLQAANGRAVLRVAAPD